MSASYPASAYSWTDRVDNVDDVMAADVNTLAAEIDAIEADLVGTGGTAGGVKRTDYASAAARLLIEIDQNNEQVVNLKIIRNATTNKLDIFAKSTGLAPTAATPIKVMIPDASGATLRSRTAAVASGTAQITLADAQAYWGKPTLNGSAYSAYVYAIWSAADSGIVWALCGRPDLINVATTATVTDENYFLLEGSSSYSKQATDYCICVGKITFEYDTGDNPDYTISAVAQTMFGGDKNNFQNIESKSVDIVQLSNFGIATNDTDAFVFDFVPSIIVLKWTSCAYHATSSQVALTTGHTVITITGTNTFTSILNANSFQNGNGSMDGITQRGDTTKVFSCYSGYNGTNYGIANCTGAWVTATKTLTVTWASTNMTDASTFFECVATAYR